MPLGTGFLDTGMRRYGDAEPTLPLAPEFRAGDASALGYGPELLPVYLGVTGAGADAAVRAGLQADGGCL